MAISFPITLPSGGQQQVTPIMVDVVGIGESPYTYSQEVFEHAGKRWAFEVVVVPKLRDDAEAWIAALASLRGRRGTFYLDAPDGNSGRGALSGSPLVKGAGQTGGTLLVDGCGATVTDWIKQGAWIQLGTGSASRLHKCLQTASSNGSGEVTLELWPGPRTAPADNEAVVVASPKGVFRLDSNERRYTVGIGKIYGGIAFTAVEAF